LIAAGFVAQPAGWAAISVRRYIVEAFVMPTRSMLPAVAPGDRVLCHKRLPYARWRVMVLREPERGEFVIKRLVGMPGDTIEIANSVLHINGNPVASPPGVTYVSDAVNNYHINGPGCEGHPIRLGPDEYYFLGDNSPISADARFWNALPGHQRGALTPDRIVGTVTYTYWPPSRWRKF
jgi:signal peptidase I